jgi:hypothetical protein
MAVARYFGWSAVSGPDRMTWAEFALARQYLVEERIGSKVREAQEIERMQARESAKNVRRAHGSG